MKPATFETDSLGEADPVQVPESWLPPVSATATDVPLVPVVLMSPRSMPGVDVACAAGVDVATSPPTSAITTRTLRIDWEAVSRLPLLQPILPLGLLVEPFCRRLCKGTGSLWPCDPHRAACPNVPLPQALMEGVARKSSSFWVKVWHSRSPEIALIGGRSGFFGPRGPVR